MVTEQLENLDRITLDALLKVVEKTWANMPFQFAQGSRQIWETYQDIFVQPETQQWSNMLDMFVSGGVIDKVGKENLLKLKDLGHPLDWLYYVLIILMLIKSHLDITTWSTSGFVRQELNQNLRSELPHVQEVMRSAFIAPEKTAEVREILAKQGYPEDVINLMFLAQYKLYDENKIKELYNRGAIDKNTMYERMRELGYTDTRIVEIIQSWELIPSPQDLIYLVGKEAFEPDSVEALGLDAEYPKDVEQWFEKQGLSKYWVEKFWAAHWSPPSLEMGFEMFHRDVIDRDTLEFLFKTVEVPPFFRDKLMEIAFNPYTRVDVRRMHDLGVIDDEDLITAYRHLGYDKEKATKMAEFTVVYNRGAEKEITKGEIIKGYSKYVLTRDDSIDLLLSLGYTEALAEFYLDMEDRAKIEYYENEMLDVLKQKYTDNVITKLQARDWLGKMNFPAQYIESELELWDIRKLSDYKKPSKTDLDKFLKANIIDKDTYQNEMEKLGYGITYISWYYQAALGKKGG